MTLINGWKTWHKWWSTRLKAVGAMLMSVTTAVMYLPEHILYAWSIIPHDIKSTFPAGWVSTLGIGLVIASSFAQLVRQKDLHADTNREKYAAEFKSNNSNVAQRGGR